MERTAVEVKVQRAIEARYLPDARAERLAAQKRSREARRPAPSRVGWNKRASKADLARDEAAAAAKAARVLEPEDQAIRDAIAERDARWSRKTNATSATMESAEAEEACIAARTRSGSLARLFATGAIDAHQLAAAVDIAGEAERIARDVAVKTASLETRIDAGQRGGGAAFESLAAVRRAMAFTDWRSALGLSARPVLDMIVDDAGLVAVARRHRIGRPRALALLTNALDLWPGFMRDARHAVDADALARVEARLA